ncbi:unnamed protein product [Strongylus vulgaris]|uniref:Uncharacterized protein n=1 Tax=Strongylus vulgaris TaxID=40348 RepID=A0A3P7IYR9_STRVU|nr:unnamed protein product [Strongylus vulgaris]
MKFKVARDSYLDYLAKEAGGTSSQTSNLYEELLALETAEPSQTSDFYEELLAIQECGGWPDNEMDEDRALAQALAMSEVAYMEELQLRFGCEPEDTNNNNNNRRG